MSDVVTETNFLMSLISQGCFSSSLLTIPGMLGLQPVADQPFKVTTALKSKFNNPFSEVDSDLWPCGSLNDHCHFCNDCHKNNGKLESDHMVTWLATAMTYDQMTYNVVVSCGLPVICLMFPLSPKHSTVFQILLQGIGDSWIDMNLTKCLASNICCGFLVHTKKCNLERLETLAKVLAIFLDEGCASENSEIGISPEKQGSATYSKISLESCSRTTNTVFFGI